MPLEREKRLLPVRRWAPPRKGRPALVLLHGLYGHSAQWWLYVAALRDAFDIVALDMRNHGFAFHSPTQRHDEMASDVVRTLGAIGLERYWLMGHSMGGRVAMRVAQLVRERVLGCVSLDAPIPTEQFSPKLERYHQRVVQLLKATVADEGMPREALGRELAARGLDRQMAGYALRNYVLRGGKWRWRIGFEGIADHVNHRLSEPLEEGALACPFLLVEAKQSILCRRMEREKFERFAPGGARAVDEGASHLTLLFRPAVAAEWLHGVCH